MKKVSLFLVWVFCALVVSTHARTLYLNPGGNEFWEQGGAQFAAWHWTDGGDDGQFSAFFAKDSISGYYSSEVSDSSNRIIFVRFSNTATAPTWTDTDIWNKTVDLVLGEENLFTITSWGNGLRAPCEGVWSTYTPASEPDEPNPDEPNPDEPNPDEPNPDEPNPDEPNPDEPNPDEPFTPTTPDLPQDCASAVPSQCGDVMLQAFYWDSNGGGTFGDTKWSTLQGQTSEINAYFDMVWLPPSAKSSGGVGYHPAQYCNQNSAWGSRAELEQLIASFHAAGTKVVADIVINHAANKSSWCDFYEEDFGSYGKFNPDASWICKTDEMNSDSGAGSCKGKATGAIDDGYGGEANYGAARDWDHQSDKVREMFRAYAKWMKGEMKYDGFRYDYCKGFKNSHIKDYNRAAQTYFSVMEYWDGNPDVLISRLNDAGWNTLTFDFATKYTAFNNNLASGSFAGFKGCGLLGKGKGKYAVTFVDNHDTHNRDGNEFCGKGNSMTADNKAKTIQANAFILSMPGVPCVFYPHWKTWKSEIGPMILARKAVGVHSESAVKDEGDASGYRATVTGKNGTLIAEFGNRVSSTKDGYTKAASGTGYVIWTQLTHPVAPQLIISQGTCTYKSGTLSVSMRTVGGTETATIYYTLDGTDPRTSTTRLTYSTPLTITGTVTLTAYATTANTQTEVQQCVYTYKAPQTTPIIVAFYKPASWSKVNLYAWLKDGSKTTELCGGWPGTQMTVQNGEGYYYHQFDAEVKEVNFIFNNGSDQTADLWTDEDVCYTWSNGAEVLVPDCKVPMGVANTEQDNVPALDLTQPMYNVLGQPVGADYHGVVIQNAHKYLR